MILRALLSTALLAYACITRPSRARCPVGWYVGNGVRPSGVFECVESPPRGEYDCSADRVCPQPVSDAAEVEGRVYCTSGHVPVVVNERVVSCQARH